MSNVLYTEWLKIKSYRPFWIVFILYPVCLGGVTAMSVWGQTQVRDVARVPGAASGIDVDRYLPFAFPTAWQSVAYAASWMHFIPALLLILIVTNEFSFRTHRQNLLEGWSRARFLAAKALIAVGLSIFSTVVVLLCALAAGLSTHSSPTFSGLQYVGWFLLQSVLYNSFALTLAFVIRRAAISLAAFAMYSVILENLLAFILNHKLKGLGYYLPLEAGGSLIPVPILKEKAREVLPALITEPSQEIMVLTVLIYLILFASFLWVRFRREDL